MKSQLSKLRRALSAFALTGAMLPIADLCAQVTIVDSQNQPIASGANLAAVGSQWSGNTAVISSDITEPGGVYLSGSDVSLTIKSDKPGTWRTLNLNGENRLIKHVFYGSGEGLIKIHGEDVIVKNGYGEFGNLAGFIVSDRAVELTGNMQIIGCQAEEKSVVRTNSSITVDGTFVFDGNKATKGSCAVFSCGWLSSLEYPTMTIKGNNTFTNNYAYQGATIVGFNGYHGELVVEGTNVFNNNSADMGSAVFSSSSGGDITISGNNQFNNNTVKGEAHYFTKMYQSGSVIQASNDVYISGTTEFKNNTIAGKYGAGAIYIENGNGNLYFTGDGSSAVFSGNTFENVDKGLDPVKNDIKTHPNWKSVSSDSPVTFTNGLTSFEGTGTYSFDGGIEANKLAISGSSVTFEAGSQSFIASLALSGDAALTIDMTNGTKFDLGHFYIQNSKMEMGVSDPEEYRAKTDFVFTDDGTNSINIIFDHNNQTSGIIPIANANYLENMTSSLILTPNSGVENKRFVNQFLTSGIEWAMIDCGDFVLYRNEEYQKDGNSLKGLGTVQANDVVEMTNNGVAGGTVAVPANLTIRSNSLTSRTLSGDQTLISDAENLTLNNVVLKINDVPATDVEPAKPNDAPVLAAKGDSVTITALGNSGLSGKNLLTSSLAVAGSGSLRIDGAIGQNLTVNNYASVAATENTAIGGNLNIDGSVIFESIDADGVNVGGDIQFNADTAHIVIAFDDAVVSYTDAEEVVLFSGQNISKQTNLSNWDVSIIDSVASNLEILPQLTLSQLENGSIVLSIAGANAVPEPASWALLVLGGLGIGFLTRRNRKN